MSNKRLISVLGLVIGLSVLSLAPGVVPVLLIIGVVLSKQWKQQGRGSLIDWLSEQMGFDRKENSQQQRDDPFGEIRRNIPAEGDRKPPRRNDEDRPRPPARQKEQGDAYPYSREEEKYSSQQYIGSTGKDPWDLPSGMDPWDLPPEHPPWEK